MVHKLQQKKGRALPGPFLSKELKIPLPLLHARLVKAGCLWAWDVSIDGVFLRTRCYYVAARQTPKAR